MFVCSADKNRDTLDPDELATAPDLEDDGLYDFFARYVRRVHSDDFTKKTLFKNPQTSFVDIIGPSDIAYIICIIKNSGEVWDQNMKMKAKGDRAIGSGEEKKKPLFTKGEGAKRIKGETLWNNEGRKYFARAEAKWREIYNDEEQMKVIYNKWEVWIDTKGKEIKIGDGSKKTFKSVMGMWYLPMVATEHKSEGEEEGDGGYGSDRGRGRVSLGWQKGALREMRVIEEIGDKESDSSSDDESKESGEKGKGGRTLVYNEMEKDSPAKNTRKKKAATDATESPATKRGSPAAKRGRGKKG